MEKQCVWFGRDDFALLYGEGHEWKDIGNGWIVYSKVTQEGFTMVAGASTDSICHFMTHIANFLELGMVVLIYAEMEAKCLVGFRNRREVNTCSFIG